MARRYWLGDDRPVAARSYHLSIKRSIDRSRSLTRARSLSSPLQVATLKLNATENAAVFDGETKIVPSLKAPGFCNMQVEGAKFPDISSKNSIKLVARSAVAYGGWKFSFGPAPRHGFFDTYKTDFNITVADEWQTIILPYNSFSSAWSDTTGQPTTPCSKAHPEVCPDASHLAKLNSMEISAEGVAGKFHLEVKAISATTTK